MLSTGNKIVTLRFFWHPTQKIICLQVFAKGKTILQKGLFQCIKVGENETISKLLADYAFFQFHLSSLAPQGVKIDAKESTRQFTSFHITPEKSKPLCFKVSVES